HMVLFLSLLLLIFSPITSSLRNFPVVKTSYGAVRGYEYDASNGFKGEIFKKIPYAAPPTGALRWKKPQPPQPWNYTIDGTFFGPSCAQRTPFWEGSVTGFSEDCLNINVYSSKKCRMSGSSCPVAFLIHGGVVLFDGTQMFPDDSMIGNFAAQGIVMVTVDYRLGIFGTLALGDENVLPANLALHDMVEGLHFVRKEIHNFGGDKDQITVMGHSTGGAIALLFAFSPGINKPGEPAPFSRVIAMSGSAYFENEERQVMRSHSVAGAIGCKGSAKEIIDCLMPLSTDYILNITELHGGENAFSDTQIANIVYAGDLMPMRNVQELWHNQKVTKLMLGTAMNEFELEYRKGGVNPILGVKNDKECYQKYVNDRDSAKFVPGHFTETQAIFMTEWLFANTQAKAGGEVYLYQYDYPVHAVHTEDAYYVFGFHPHSKDENEEWLSRVYPIYFTNFIKGLPLAPDWEPLNPDLMNYYSVNKSFTDDVSPMMKSG
ncbi:hypothetical protein PFISCL1PPCAC_24591, partial [Pristionchus fissidentatus]